MTKHVILYRYNLLYNQKSGRNFMEETKAYKLNKEKQPAGEKGKFLYYFYNNETLDSVAVDEE